MFSTNFIAAGKEYCTFLHHVPAPYLRKNITLGKLPEKAEITICGLGFYELFINGERITKGALAPYISNPDDILYYDHYDIARFLRAGNNTVGIMLGNGMLNCFGGTVWDFQKARFRSAPKVAFAIELTSGQEVTTITADESVRVHPSPIQMDDLRIGEFYDARKEIEGWNLPDFDDSGWQNAIPAEAPRGVPTLCTADPIVTLWELSPLSITPERRAVLSDWWHPLLEAELGEQIPLPEKYSHGYLYDFGENLAGNTTLRIKGERGQEISILYGELLTEEGDLDKSDSKFLPHFYDHRVTYTLKGEGVEEYTPFFSYQGFRYCLVTGLTPEQATKDLLTYKVMSSDLKKNGDFHCSDEVVNRIQKATYNADIANFFYFPTDCPHREKNGWTGDAALSAEQMLFNLSCAGSYRVWLDNIRASQLPSGEIPCVIPTAGWGFEWGNGPAWDAALFQLPYQTWRLRGDTDIITENAAAMVQYLHYVSTRRDEKGLLHFGLGDWVRTHYKADITPLAVTDTLTTMENSRIAAKMLGAVGMTAQASFALALFEELRSAARAEFLCKDGTVSAGTQTAQAMAIAYGLLEEAEIPAVFDKLLAAVKESDGYMDLGVLGARLLFHVLEKYGQAELAYSMITRPDGPSYGHWVLEEDCTSLFERFDPSELWPGSKNHHFWGDVSSWFFKCIAGVKINPADRDYKELEISPSFISTLSDAEGYYDHPCGRIESCWKREGQDVFLTLTIPKGCYGSILLPAGFTMTDAPALQEGTHTYRITKGAQEMDYLAKLKYHYRPEQGWVNDPNGLVYFDGYYHVFYQHAPDYEIPWQQPMHWGHARTRDFLNWEELPVALYPDQPYDAGGCWSGTAVVKGDTLYLFYASVLPPVDGKHKTQTVSVAYSKDGIHFEKYAGNPVIAEYPADGSFDFRDPAVCAVGEDFYCVMATGYPPEQKGRLLLYKSRDLFQWDYLGIMSQWDDCRYTECPSFMPAGDKYLLTASVCKTDRTHRFSIMYGAFADGKFTPEVVGEVDKGPDQYAGQTFLDHKGRNILMAWIPGWKYKGYAAKDLGCMSLPRELKVVDGKVVGYPIEEVCHLLTDSDPALRRTEKGFIIERQGRDPVVYEGEIHDLKILRDEFIIEVFVNGGKEVFTALL